MSLEEILASRALRVKREDYWRAKLEEARHRYCAASAHYRNMVDSQAKSPARYDNPVDAVRLASVAEARALAEYTRVLQLFADLIVHGKVPEDPPDFHSP